MTRKRPDGPTTASLIPSSLFARADQWFGRARAALLDAVPCHRGCCRCCIGVFSITPLDVDQLQAGLSMLPHEIRRSIQERASCQVKGLEAAFPELQRSRLLTEWVDPRLDEVAERFADLPCPALDAEGSCQIYAFRPMTCRTTGIPIDEQGVVQGACEVQTAVPLIKLSSILREQEDDLTAREAAAIETRTRILQAGTTPSDAEVFLPYGFLS